MIPAGKPEDLLFISDPRALAEMLNAAGRRAEHILSIASFRVEDDDIATISEKVYWKSYVRLAPIHIRRVLRLFPYVDRMMGKYGINDDTTGEFLDCLSTLVLGTPFHDSHSFKDLLTRQCENVFRRFDNVDDRAALQLGSHPGKRYKEPDYDFPPEDKPPKPVEKRALPFNRLADSGDDPFMDMKEKGK